MVREMGGPCSSGVDIGAAESSMTGCIAASMTDAMVDSLISFTRVAELVEVQAGETDIVVSQSRSSPQPYTNRMVDQHAPHDHLLQVEFQVC